MSLDRQRILSELGSVMNQLQSADCGCMGKLFSQSNQGDQGTMGSPLPTCGGCRRGFCHGHGYSSGAPGSGEPYSMNNNMHRPCMGHCNPPKLYADTYNYLNGHLMQPVVQEVYNDLKSITPANTVMNSPFGNEMGLTKGNVEYAGDTGASMGQNINGNMGNLAEMGSSNVNSSAMEQVPNSMNNPGGIGPQIVNMIMGDGTPKHNNVQRLQNEGGALTGSMIIDAPQSPHGQVGVTPLNLSPSVNQGHNINNMNQGNIPSSNLNSGEYRTNSNPVGTFSQNLTTQHISQPYAYSRTLPNNQMNPQENIQNNNMVGSPPNTNLNASAPSMGANVNSYGQHQQGVAKFNEMFPGVMQNGDLGFDPMAIAIQMNPANQQKVAMDTMQKLMNGGSTFNKGGMNPAGPNVSKPHAIKGPNIGQSPNQPPPSNSFVGNTLSTTQNNINEISSAQQQPGNVSGGPQAAFPQQQQVYTTGNANANQIYSQQSSEPQQQYQQQQQQIDPNAETNYNNINNPKAHSQLIGETPPQALIKEHILPADTSRNRYLPHNKPQSQYEYNTLGQPIEMLPAQLYRPEIPNLPQTLSPQHIPSKIPNDYRKFSNVKSTVSKTSIMGNKPIGRNPSKSQLQHLYNQYKTSQSFTQQNIRPPPQASSLSEGNLNAANANNMIKTLMAPIEKVGGDTTANNPDSNQLNKVDQVFGQIGDVPVANKPMPDETIKPVSPVPVARQAICRNGLQDVVYTSYPSSAAWSFHGTNDHRPLSVGYRFRNIAR